ncbi:MAG TPA: molybdopterin-dependent oxidoreductase [Candidatus Acidoferrales bacterium]|jgi:DMSO/TMAO reductase YedYZ molybdopterin-dependent catalytic subunit|nr:molybdopterin-dependent oxidoreductase [Candidatus Acidoferrales bacterium]
MKLSLGMLGATRAIRSGTPILLVMAVLCCAWPGILAQAVNPSSAPAAGADSKPPGALLSVGGDVQTPLSLSLADLSAFPRKTLKVMNEHAGKEETYQGVPLAEILKRAGVPQGSVLRGAALATYVRAEGEDGYSVIFSLAELDVGIQDSDVMVADTMDGGPIADKLGPLRLVAPHEKRPARWVRMLRSITVVKVSH